MPSAPVSDMIAAGRTDVGRVRSRNEDNFALVPQVGLAVVCDGMGGHAGGDIASRTAATIIADSIANVDPQALAGAVDSVNDDTERTLSGPTAVDPGLQLAIAAVRVAVRDANRRIVGLNQERGFAEGRGMGTTVVGCLRVAGTDKLVVFHAGDSRLYRLRAGGLRQLTRDHSLYQIWLDNGGQGQAPQKNIIVRALGTTEHMEPEVTVHALEPGDTYMLCSDGLTGMVTDPTIAEVLGQPGADADGLCGRLIQLANDQGGVDNTTVVIARFGA